MKKLLVIFLALSTVFFQPVFAEELIVEPQKSAEVVEPSISPRIIWEFKRTAPDTNRLVSATVTIACAETTSYSSGFEILGYNGITLAVTNSSYSSVQLLSVNSMTISTNRQSLTLSITYRLRDTNGLWTSTVNGIATVYI